MSSNGNQGNSSFWRPRGSNEDKQPAPISSGWGRPVSSNHLAAGGGESKRPPSSFKPPAAGGSGWGRPPGPLSSSAAVGGKWGPSSLKPQASGGAARPSPPLNFTVVLIAALLLLPGVTQPIANQFTQDYIQRNHILDPHTQNDIDRAIAAFNRQHQQKPPAPPEGYTPEYVTYCFHAKYDLPENLHARFVEVVSSYITKTPKPFTMALGNAVDRALLHIHEIISNENGGGQIPERESSKIAQKTESQEFFERLTKHLLKSYLWITPEIVHAFISEYRLKRIDQLFFSESTLDDDAYQMRVKFAFSELHFHHADYFFRTSFINPFVLIGFHDGVLPVSALHPSFHRIVELATIPETGYEVMNAFVFVYKPEYDLQTRLETTLIGHSYQSDPIYAKWNFQSRLFVKVDSGFSIGDILMVMPKQILKVGRPVVKQVMWRAGGGSQYAEAIEIGKQITDYMPPESHKVAGGKVDWKDTNAVVEMTAFQKFMFELGGKKIKVVPS